MFREWQLLPSAMRPSVLALLLFAAPFASLSAFAQDAGSHLLTTPEVPLAPQPVVTDATKRCDTLPREERERCVRNAQAREPSRTPLRGPESTGMGSGAGVPAASGSSGGASFGGSAPR